MSGHRSRKIKSKAQANHADAQLVIAIARGEVMKIEALDASGERRELSEEEFAEIAGEDALTDLEDALDAAYAAGVNDAIDDSIEGALDADQDEEIRRAMLREAAARQFVCRGLSRLVLRRALQRGPKRIRARSANNGVHETPER